MKLKLMKNINLNLPSNAKINIWETKDFDFINIDVNIDDKKFILTVSKENIESFFIDKWSNSIVFVKKNQSIETTKIENSINNFLGSLTKYYFSKVKFKGKGFRIKILKKNKIIKFFFGRSHITITLLKKILKKRINKYKFILKSINKPNLNKISKSITNIKKFNVYTLRGIRLSKQIIYKRKGKKGTYI